MQSEQWLHQCESAGGSSAALGAAIGQQASSGLLRSLAIAPPPFFSPFSAPSTATPSSSPFSANSAAPCLAALPLHNTSLCSATCHPTCMFIFDLEMTCEHTPCHIIALQNWHGTGPIFCCILGGGLACSGEGCGMAHCCCHASTSVVHKCCSAVLATGQPCISACSREPCAPHPHRSKATSQACCT